MKINSIKFEHKRVEFVLAKHVVSGQPVIALSCRRDKEVRFTRVKTLKVTNLTVSARLIASRVYDEVNGAQVAGVQHMLSMLLGD